MKHDVLFQITTQNVYSMAFEAALKIYELSNRFPHDDPHKLHNSIIRSSSAVCSNLQNAWQNREIDDIYVDRLNLASIEANETQNKLISAVKLGYLKKEEVKKIDKTYQNVIEKIANMIEGKK